MIFLLEQIQDLISDRARAGRVTLLVLAGVLGLIVFCGVMIAWEVDSWHLHEGTVVSKSHHPMWIQQNCTSDGKQLNCYPIIHPETWSVTIEGVDDRGRQSSRSVNVSEQKWNELEQGDHLKVD